MYQFSRTRYPLEILKFLFRFFGLPSGNRSSAYGVQIFQAHVFGCWRLTSEGLRRLYFMVKSPNEQIKDVLPRYPRVVVGTEMCNVVEGGIAMRCVDKKVKGRKNNPVVHVPALPTHELKITGIGILGMYGCSVRSTSGDGLSDPRHTKSKNHDSRRLSTGRETVTKRPV